MPANNYHPESYWTEVANRIEKRPDRNVVAGDDEPYYRYKRNQVLDMLRKLDWKDRNVLEFGCGPGGNLKEIAHLQPKSLTGMDISQRMLEMAKVNLEGLPVHWVKTNGHALEVQDNAFDLIFTVTVLQHNTDELQLEIIIKELCRVGSRDIYIYEKTASRIRGDILCLARPVSHYASIFKKNGFVFVKSNPLKIYVSYLICGIIRKLLNPSSRKEGEPLNSLSTFLQRTLLPFTQIIDPFIPVYNDLTEMHFTRKDADIQTNKLK
ncbi:MAG TPA: methyltransferase domain-containing protein [Saprospiraceae bacterium]|nr:methyltransferase domain-containing protein [Saprospiraceae bacterium]